MVHVGWLVGVVITISVLNYLVLRSVLSELRATNRALIAKNPKDLVMLETAAATRPPTRRRVAPEHEADFAEPAPRPLGL